MRRPCRPLTTGEIALLRGVFGDGIAYGQVRVHPQRLCWPFPRDRAMAPNGHLYFPGCYEDDFAGPAVSLRRRALFVHEGAHLYQWYGLQQWVWLRGPFDRRYAYALVPGKPYEAYGLEQMGMIAEHYYLLANGGRTGLPWPIEAYRAILPALRGGA